MNMNASKNKMFDRKKWNDRQSDRQIHMPRTVDKLMCFGIIFTKGGERM